MAEPTDLLLSRFWEIEEPSSPAEAFTPEEEKVQHHFLNTYNYHPSVCRYRVILPRKRGMPPLRDSRSQALQRNHSNERAILRKNTWEPFQTIVQEYLDLGHAEPVPPHSLVSTKETYYLPMHAITKESSTSTKLRVVFDASAQASNGISLNDSLFVGPTLHPKLETILLRFRTYPVALTADISKMYRVVEFAEPDKDLHRFVWRAQPSDTVTDYRMTRVTFGVATAPYLAIKALQQMAADFGEHHTILKHRNQLRITTPHLTTTEVNRAEHHLLIRAQARSFPNEVYQLQRDKSISHSSKVLVLSPVIDKDGLLHVGGRLSNHIS